MKRILCLIAVTILIGGSLSAQTSDESVMKAVTEYDGAWNKKDAAAVGRMLADDYVYFTSTGGLTTRKSTLDFLASPDYKLAFVERSEIKLISRSENIAIVSSRWKGRGTYRKEEINDDQRCGLIFVRQSNRWKLLSEHCTQIVSK
jgi:ketosteroid isomerase-like protein